MSKMFGWSTPDDNEEPPLSKLFDTYAGTFPKSAITKEMKGTGYG